MEHRQADLRQVAGYGASGDDAARFLRELRQLRDEAGLGHAELAARAHFPYDSIRAAEVGPALPDLPVLCAYVRGCGGTTEEWEERWRSLTRSPSLPVATSRTAGHSDAATAGARIGSVSQVGESPDPSVIIAALSRVAEEMASPGGGPVPPSPEVQAAGEGHVPADASFPPSAAPPGPAAGGTPKGWDPIRVSAAWPALRDTPAAVEQGAPGAAGAPGLSGAAGAGAPWGAAPWAKNPVSPDPLARGVADIAAPATPPAFPAKAPAGPVFPATTPPAGPAAPAAGNTRPAGRGAARPVTSTRAVVIVAVLLCVLAVLLAVFA